jgi:hypothetical protein
MIMKSSIKLSATQLRSLIKEAYEVNSMNPMAHGFTFDGVLDSEKLRSELVAMNNPDSDPVQAVAEDGEWERQCDKAVEVAEAMFDEMINEVVNRLHNGEFI